MRPDGGIEAGAVLLGKYKIESVIGRGGMGLVYRAVHLHLNELVAIKVLRSDVQLDDEAVTRFQREAQAAVRLKSEHVARIHDVGVFDDGSPYMVMEFLAGADLGTLVDTNGPTDVPTAVDLILQACDALAEAHACGIVHRDVKPSNLFVTAHPDGTHIVKVLDFGISKSATGTDLSLTQTASVLGTPAYMSPEQMRSARRVDARTDIWSLGTVLYELVEGKRPFKAETFSEMCVMAAVDPHDPMIRAPTLEPIISRCLAKTPEGRFQSVAELAAALAPLARDPTRASYYVTRTHRVLGRARTPTPVPTTPTPAPTPMRGVDSGPVALPLPMPRTPPGPAAGTLADESVPSLKRSRAAVWIPLVAVLVAGATGLVIWQSQQGSEPAANVVDDGPVIKMNALPAGTAAGHTGSSAGSSTESSAGSNASADLAGSGAGSGAGSSASASAGSPTESGVGSSALVTPPPGDAGVELAGGADAGTRRSGAASTAAKKPSTGKKPNANKKPGAAAAASRNAATVGRGSAEPAAGSAATGAGSAKKKLPCDPYASRTGC